jgi:penicillin-binding protein 1A
MMNAMLRETLLTGTARKAELPGWDAAGKTGTSQDHRDAWFVGYTGSLVAGVWLGNDDGTPTKRTSGSNLPVEIWSRFMKQALAGTPAVALPGGGWRAAPPAAEVPVASLQGGDPGNPSPPPPPAPTRATGAGPLVITPIGAGSAPAAPAPLPPRRAASEPGVPRPPGSVGQGPSRAAPPPPSERSMLDRLFGG